MSLKLVLVMNNLYMTDKIFKIYTHNFNKDKLKIEFQDSDPQEFMKGINLLNDKKFYFIYCRSGARSAQACQLFKQSGIKNCFNLLGGILEWKGQITKD